MRGLSLGYVIRRVGMFFFTIWASATVMFFIPRLAPGDPVSAMVTRLTSQAGRVEGSAALITAWRQRFGLDDPLLVQYLRYLRGMLTFDFGYSLAQFPTEVGAMVGRAMPWTIGLLLISTVLTFLAGTLIGALMAWRRTPRLLRWFLPVSLTFTAIPFYILGIVLVYVFVFALGLFPVSGGYRNDLTPGFDFAFINSVIQHGTLPAMSIVLASMGFWALGMRGMMVTVAGEDYLTLARAKGLRPLDVLFRYEVRNAILPQVTALVLGLGGIVGGTVLVEYLFGYPGMGALLYQGITNSDFTVIQGIVFILILTTVTAVLIVDLIYPLLDPRITYERR
ncbi:ABC transporter permease [Actinopolymorpha alba]|uniref:ABC transporter permease n=1 Tax=Actinopolymorpha alba TaxID=533267 RepID=UPI000375FD11|nr:ABC transporter permease [Actinopolymorpha alba]